MFDLDIKDLNESLKGQDVTPRKKTAFFSICSNNYMAYAQTLFDSIRVYHPEFDRFLCVVDDKLDLPDFYPPDSEILFAHELGIPDFDSFAFQYDIMELNTAVKPFVIQKLFDARYDHVIYLDPDIEVFRRLDSVVDALDCGSSFVMTPHLCTPAENDAEPGDRAIMRAGVYNLGFLASSNQRETFPVLRWWSRRLRFECRDEQDRGTFVDQKFMDLVPGFTDHTHILRDTTLNVAYWNLKQRRLTKDGQSWFVDGRPLSFFHFSGIEPGNLAMLSKHTSHFRGE